ncbi:hypothetical protein KOW79_008228 [Hemibagrus wyckioides]|uniref:Uncharacterized protein n=1 Tax=Hemibagrus wyckioides TaxID=337641 RepID=A0A9D3NTF1_9TELE|nr:hypothetical protein KOW79_008228 [Hemibagrus wyckioides]
MNMLIKKLCLCPDFCFPQQLVDSQQKKLLKFHPKILRRTEEGHPNIFRNVEQLKMELNETLHGLRKSVMEDRRVMEQNGERDHAHWLSVELTPLPKFKGTGAQKAGFVQAYLPGGCCLSGLMTVGCFHYVPTVFVPCSQRSQPTVQHFPSLRLPAVLSSWESLRACPSTGTLPSN